MVEFVYTALKYLTGLLGFQHDFINMWEATRNYLDIGGDLLLVIVILMTVMWVMIIERLIYFSRRHPLIMRHAIDKWNARKERKSWYAYQVRGYLISEVKLMANRSLDLIRTCVALCLLLALLGAVAGTAKVFYVMAILGTGNVRALAYCVSQATIPAMSGMVAALSGVFLCVWLRRKANMEIDALREHMVLDH